MKSVLKSIIVCFLLVSSLKANNPYTITGTVVNARNKPIPTASAHIEKSLLTAQCDEQGHFELHVPIKRTYIVVFRANGYTDFSMEVTIPDSGTIDVGKIKLIKAPEHKAEKDENKNGKFDQLIVNVGVQQGWRTTGQVSIGLCDQKFRFKRITPIWHLRQIHAGTMFVIRQDPILGPKISYDATADGTGYLSLLTYGVDFIYYTDRRSSGFYLNPHFGITAFAFYNLLIGYNVPLQRCEMNEYVNRLEVTLNIPLFKRISTKTLK